MKKLSLDEIKKISVSALEEVANFCEENGLVYFLAYGTLIGAIRHKGFIPWDDDVDIVMPRDDYEKFIRMYPESDEYKVVSCITDKEYFNTYAKVVCKKTITIQHQTEIVDRGLGIDVFPLDSVYDNVGEAEKAFKKHYGKYKKLLVRYSEYLRLKPQNSIKYKVAYLLKKIGILHKICVYLSWRPSGCKYGTTKHLGLVVGMFSPHIEHYSINDFFPIRREKFENRYYNIPNNYDRILREYYGNYMELPPKSKRISTHSEIFAWRK